MGRADLAVTLSLVPLQGLQLAFVCQSPTERQTASPGSALSLGKDPQSCTTNTSKPQDSSRGHLKALGGTMAGSALLSFALLWHEAKPASFGEVVQRLPGNRQQEQGVLSPPDPPAPRPPCLWQFLHGSPWSWRNPAPLLPSSCCSSCIFPESCIL